MIRLCRANGIAEYEAGPNGYLRLKFADGQPPTAPKKVTTAEEDAIKRSPKRRAMDLAFEFQNRLKDDN